MDLITKIKLIFRIYKLFLPSAIFYYFILMIFFVPNREKIAEILGFLFFIKIVILIIAFYSIYSTKKNQLLYYYSLQLTKYEIIISVFIIDIILFYIFKFFLL